MPIFPSSSRLGLTLACAALVAPLARIPAQDADLIVRNARIWTGDSTRPRAEAVAVRGERLIAVGTNAEADAHRAAHTRVIDAGGRFITPGFIDDHTHFAQAGALLIGANLLDVHTATPFAERVKAAARRSSPGAWLTGGDWGAYEDNPANATGGAVARPVTHFSPDRSIIDSVTPGTPALLNRWDRSAWLGNGGALQVAGATCDRPIEGLECVGGNATGRISGAALARVRAAVAPRFGSDAAVAACFRERGSPCASSGRGGA